MKADGYLKTQTIHTCIFDVIVHKIGGHAKYIYQNGHFYALPMNVQALFAFGI